MAERLRVLMVTHGAAAAAVAAARALFASTGVDPVDVHVLDNSPDDSVRRKLAAVDPGPSRLVVSEIENRGFGAAVNVGARQAHADGCELLLIVNPDCVVRPETIAALVELPVQRGELVSSPILAPGEGGVERFGGAAHHRWTSRNEPVGHGLTAADAESRQQDLHAQITIPTGAFLLMRTEDLVAAGYFDEDLFLYYEEVSLVARMRRAGLSPRVRVVAGSAVVHVGGASTGSTVRQSPLTRFHASRSAVITARKYDRATLPTVLLSRIALAAAEMRVDRAGAQAVLSGIRAGLCHR